MPDDKFEYKEGDLKLVKEGTGPSLEEMFRESERRQKLESDPEIGRADPGFHAPRPEK